MQNLAYISQSFNVNKTSSYNLSIQCSLDGLSFCIINSDDQCLVLKNIPLKSELSPEAWQDKLNESLKDEILFRGMWKQVRITWSSRKSLMIPHKLFRVEDLRSYLVLHQMLDEFDEIHYMRLKNPDAWIVFPIPSLITQIFINHFQGALFYHQAIPMIETIFNRKHEQVPDGVHINLHSGFFDYALVYGGELHTFNSFSWKDANDVLYLLVYLFKQFDFSPKVNELVLYGMGSDQQEIIKLLKKYFANIRVSEPDERLQVQGIPDLNSSFLYTNLLNLYFCES